MNIKEGPIILISTINKEIDFLFESLLTDLGITKMETMYLRTIYENPGVTQYAIAKKRSIDKSLVIKYITKLEEKGLIEKKQLDSRRKGLYLTKDGDKAIKFVDNFLPKLQEKFQSLFTKNEFEIFLDLLKRFKSRLEVVNEREYSSGGE